MSKIDQKNQIDVMVITAFNQQVYYNNLLIYNDYHFSQIVPIHPAITLKKKKKKPIMVEAVYTHACVCLVACPLTPFLTEGQVTGYVFFQELN